MTENNKQPAELYRLAVKVHGKACVGVYLDVITNSKRLDDELANIRRVLANIKGDAVRENYYRWLLDVMPREVERTVAEAKRRLSLLLQINTRERIEEEIARCRESIHYWLDNYAVTCDPRHPLFLLQPFLLYDFQRELTDFLHHHIFEVSSSCLVEKSRAVGATWLGVCMFGYEFLFSPVPVQVLALSRTGAETDTLGDASTLFEKWRVLFRSLPRWMVPKDLEMPHLRVVRHDTGAFIVGAASSRSVRRGGRFSAVWLDEFAHMQHDAEILTAIQQTTNARLYTSTPNGNANEFARLRFSGSVPVFTAHWSRHPFRGREWYEFQKTELDERQIAQELDIDYLSSGSGRVFRHYSEPHSVITWSEFARAFGSDSIPPTWERVMGHDWGGTAEHANVCLWAARAPEGTTTSAGVDVSGCIFVYREFVAPVGATPADVAEAIRALEGEDENPSRVMSHERKTERILYAQDGLVFSAYAGRARDELSKIHTLLRVDDGRPHPFRRVLDGAPRLYFIVADGQGELVQAEAGGWQVKPARDSRGLARLRAEVARLQYKEGTTEPQKIFDDAVDAMKMIVWRLFRPVDDALRLQVQREIAQSREIAEMDGAERAALFSTRIVEGDFALPWANQRVSGRVKQTNRCSARAKSLRRGWRV